MNEEVLLMINGRERKLSVDPERTLLDVLREDLQLTGTKYGCGEAQCGACTVLIDGKPTRSCVLPVKKAQKGAITTIEGLSSKESLHPVQEAFVAEGAVQCGYCTPGMILTAKALLDRKSDPTDAEIDEWMNRNICRCCGYTKIRAAIHRASRNM